MCVLGIYVYLKGMLVTQYTGRGTTGRQVVSEREGVLIKKGKKIVGKE